jgi:hypothetical protein
MFRLKINPRKIFRVSLIVIAVLVVMDIVSRWTFSRFGTPVSARFKDFFDVDIEHNVPSFLSFFQLLVAGFILMMLAALSGKKKDGNRNAWAVLSIIFCYLAVDELEEIHETMVNFFRNTFHTTGLLYHAWVIPMVAFVIVLGIIYLPFLLRLPKRTRIGIMVAGIAYVASAAGGDMISGVILTKYPQLVEHRAITIENLLEEMGEMVSIAYFIYVLLSYLRDSLSDVVLLTFSGGTNRSDEMLSLDGGTTNLRVINVEKKKAK